jgi:hypothetical protein
VSPEHEGALPADHADFMERPGGDNAELVRRGRVPSLTGDAADRPRSRHNV